MTLRPAVHFYNYRGNVLTETPVVEPVSLAELKAALVIDGTAEDDFLESLITEARQEIEEMTGLAMVTQEWRLALDNWPLHRGEWWDGVRQGAISEIGGPRAWVDLPRYPLQTVDAVRVFAIDGTSQSVAVSDVLDVDTYQKPGRLALKVGQTWPIALRDINGVEIDYTAGYGLATAVPAPLKRAVRQMAAYMYEHRGDGCAPADAYMKSGAAAIAGRYAVVEV